MKITRPVGAAETMRPETVPLPLDELRSKRPPRKALDLGERRGEHRGGNTTGNRRRHARQDRFPG